MTDLLEFGCLCIWYPIDKLLVPETRHGAGTFDVVPARFSFCFFKNTFLVLPWFFPFRINFLEVYFVTLYFGMISMMVIL